MLFKSKAIAVRELRRGHVIVFGDGVTKIVQDAQYGDGAIYYRDRMARVIVIRFTTGKTMNAHPAEPVRVLRQLSNT